MIAIELIKLIIIMYLFLSTTILIVKYVKGCTFDEAIKNCVDFTKIIVREFVNVPKPMKPNYPLIGEYGYTISYQNVKIAFEKLSKYFKVIFYDKYDNTLPNRIVYRFKISTPTIEIDYIDFIDLLQLTVEEILTTHMNDNGICIDIPYDEFIAVKIVGNQLFISIAKNDEGIIETRHIKDKIRKNYFTSQCKKERPDILADWDDNKK